MRRPFPESLSADIRIGPDRGVSNYETSQNFSAARHSISQSCSNDLGDVKTYV